MPASTSNVGAGFDCIGVAVERSLTARVHAGGPGGVTMRRSGTLAALSEHADQDRLVRAFRATCDRARQSVPDGLHFDVDSTIPIARGLGSSAAAAVAGITLASALLGLGLEPGDVVSIGSALEGHPDNVAPIVHGGATLAVQVEGRVIVAPIAVHPSLALVFAVPDFRVETAQARAALPRTVTHATAVTAAARAAALVRGLAEGDARLLAIALDDVLHVPYRRDFVRGYDAVVRAAVRAGAPGATLSGSGSTIVAVTQSAGAERIADAMANAWREIGVSSETLVSRERVAGAVVEREAAAH